MRGTTTRQVTMLSTVTSDSLIPADHPIRSSPRFVAAWADAPSPVTAVGSQLPLEDEARGPVTRTIGHMPDSGTPVSPSRSVSIRF